MSQMGTIGAEFIQGGVAGLKAAALITELKRAKLENAEYQATAGHRQVLRNLAEQKGQSDLQLQSINASILQQTLANMPDTETAQEENKLGLSQKRAGLEQTQAQTGLTRANIGQVQANTRLTDANMAEQYQKVAGQIGSAAGRSAAANKTVITAEDASNIADAFLGQMNVDDSQKVKTKAFLMPHILSSGMSAMQERDMLNEANAARRVDEKLKNVGFITDIATRQPDPHAFLDSLGSDMAIDPGTLRAARAAIEGGLISKQQQAEDAKPERPWTGAEERMLRDPSEKLLDLKDELKDLQAQKAEDYKYAGRKSQVGLLLKGGVKIDTAIERKQAEINVAENELEKLKESLRPKAKSKGSTTVKLKAPKGDDEIVDFVSQEQVDNLPVGTRVRLPDGRIARKK